MTWRDNPFKPYSCYAAALIIECRENPKLKAEVLEGLHGLLDKHLIENERAWKESELWDKDSIK